MLAALCVFFLAWPLSAGGAGSPGRDYKFVYLDAKITKTSSEYFGKNCAMEVVKYNNSMPILNATFSVIKTCPEETTIEVEGFTKQNNNVYKAGGFRIPKMLYCDFLATKPQYRGLFTDFGNMPKQCPMSPGTYSVINSWIDENRFPRVTGAKGWRIDISLKVKKTCILKFSAFIRIDS